MRNKLSVLLLFVFAFYVGNISAKTKDKSTKVTKMLFSNPVNINLPAFNQTKSVDGKKYKYKGYLQTDNFNPLFKINSNYSSYYNNTEIKFEERNLNKKSIFNISGVSSNSIVFANSYFENDKWTEFDFSLNTSNIFELYIDDKKISSNYSEIDNNKNFDAKIKLEKGRHQIFIKFIKIKRDVKFSLSSKTPNFKTSLDNFEYNSIDKILFGTKLSSTSISPNGKYIMLRYAFAKKTSDKTKHSVIVKDLRNDKIIRIFRDGQESNIEWVPNSNSISYCLKRIDTYDLVSFDLKLKEEKLIASGIKKISSYSWTPDKSKIIYSVNKDYSEEWKTKKFQGMEDRLPWYRNRSQLYLLYTESGNIVKLTHGKYTSSLNDISKDSKKIVFTQSRPDYNEYPYDKQDLFQMDLETFKTETIWKDNKFGGYVQYSPDAKNLLVSAGPSCFGELGINKGEQKWVNNYDGQLFIYNIKTKKADPITVNFGPAVSQAVWTSADNILMLTIDGDYQNIYQYNIAGRRYDKLSLREDLIRSFSIDDKAENLVYYGCGVQNPNRAWLYNLKTKSGSNLAEPEKDKFQNVKFGQVKDWNYIKSDGRKIIGRVYFPPNFDKTKKYPLIVNYYGGTTPVGRSFGGRYPLNLYAAMGYVVYVLQPSGAIGFGQEYSAEHQNNWGKTTADEIISATRFFLDKNSFVDAERVGCIGASYGGFTTLLLQTRTDIFAAAISHAGISNIASYWGEGYWGYSYSTNASAHSFPWNNRDLYINQSPLFSANKIKTPILLLHGSVDTNVPLGESIQMYQALKLLKKDVEFVQIKNQNHLITNYTKRKMWNNAIFAYFAKYLKNDDSWWNELYPDKNL
ncbi:MAG: prolyl oligopeptidase family serine peptidase [Marinifilaceae bacterium]|jgi:dipeptidyl aminopeptidase/acylaminoacyl peptidase|nr:prolyl oligopeptidase family serine peptidase [Marinifilaceae bacterium]